MKKFVFLFALMMVSFLTTQAQVQEVKEAKEATKTKEVKTLDNNAVLFENENGEMEETTKPIFQFDLETHDFGDLNEGPKYDYEFKFKNIGKEPLIITNVKASCGCTTPDWPKEPIMPGAESAINVIYNTKGRMNKFNKAITITSNAVTPTKRLYIKGNVVKTEEDQPTNNSQPMIMKKDNK